MIQMIYGSITAPELYDQVFLNSSVESQEEKERIISSIRYLVIQREYIQLKIIKVILKFIGGLAVILGITSVVAINWDGITFQYNKLFWEPDATSLVGVSIGDSKSDVIFNKGEPTSKADQTYSSSFIYENEYSSEQTFISFDRDGLVSAIANYMSNLNLPFSSVDQMKEILGEEDILAITKDYLSRRYTYVDWGVTYNFKNNEVYQVQIGKVTWRNWGDGGEYFVKGRKVCPSDDCPWDEDGELKIEYEEKDYRIFLSQ